MTDNITVSRELLRQVLNAACSPYCAQDLGQLMPAIKAAIEQTAPQTQEKSNDHKLVPLRPPESILAVVRKAYGNATAYDVGHVWHEIYTRLPDAAPVQEQQPAPASKPVLLQCLGCERVGTQEQLSASTDCDCWLHTQPAPVQEPQCNPHPKAPHGFDRNASHSSHRYVCDCESWEPYDAGYNEGFHAGLKAEQALSELSAQTQEMEAQPRKAVKLSDYDVGRLTVFDGLHHVETPLLAEFIRAIEQAVWAKLGVTE